MDIKFEGDSQLEQLANIAKHYSATGTVPPKPKSETDKCDETKNKVAAILTGIKTEPGTAPSTSKPAKPNEAATKLLALAATGIAKKLTVKKKPKVIKGIGIKKGKLGKQQSRVRQLVEPKPAMQALNDYMKKNEINIHFLKSSEEQGSMPLYNCKLTVDGTLYTGIGPSKEIARTAAAETALAGVINKRHSKMETAEVELTAEEQQDAELSWTALASYAVHKLLDDWEMEGVEIPKGFAAAAFIKNKPKAPEEEDNAEDSEEEEKVKKEEMDNEGLEGYGYLGHGYGAWGTAAYAGGRTGGNYQGYPVQQSWGSDWNARRPPVKKKAKPQPVKKAKIKKTPSLVHPNGTSKAPFQLMHEMLGVDKYTVEQYEMGSLPKKTYYTTITVTEDGAVYTGVGKTKKESKHQAALASLKERYNIEIPSSS